MKNKSKEETRPSCLLTLDFQEEYREIPFF